MSGDVASQNIRNVIEDYISAPNVAASIRRMAIALKEKWDHLATAEFSDKNSDEDDEERDARDPKHEKYKSLQQSID